MRPRVLIAEDVPDLRTLMGQELRRKGVECVLTGTAREAMIAVQQAVEGGDPFSFHLLDIRLPDMDGYVVADYIYSVTPEAWVALMTAYNMEDVGARARTVRVPMLLLKPQCLDRFGELVSCMARLVCEKA